MDKLALIYSMTGYAAVTRDVPTGTLNLELRSVNNRYLDIHFRLPDEFRSLESVMREALTARLSRGKVEFRLGFSRLLGAEDLQQLNGELMQRLLELNNTVKAVLPDTRSLGVADILRWPGMLGVDTLPAEDLREPCLELMHAAMDDFVAARAREGEKLKDLLLDRLSTMRQLTIEVAPRIPISLVAFQEKLTVRLREAMVNCDDDRIRQELVLFAGKVDVDEELSRLQTHMDEVERTLMKGGPVGKRLDFFMQELNREANTLGSKSADAEVSKVAMELKVLIEQMREQVQNLE